MDTRDVSSDSQVVAMMRQWQQSADRARKRKGQLVTDHPPRDQLISTFMMKVFTSSMRPQRGEGTIYTSQLPIPYPPCVRPIDELQPIAISGMRLETHHRGKMTLLRVRTPPDRMTAVMAMVEDQQGTVCLLQLYYQPDESVMPAQRILQPDDVYILKEPFFKCATDGSYSLRVDHLGDIVQLEKGGDRVPSEWRKPALDRIEHSESVRMQGNESVQEQRWREAEQLYSSAIQAAATPEEGQLAYLNRSLANIRLGLPEQALSDARNGSDDASPSEKGLYREARALYELGDFTQCLERLQALSEAYPQNATAKPEMDRARARLHEQQTGEYDFRRMYKLAQQAPPLIDCATFSAPVGVRASPGRGRGLFTTVPVVAGQLLVCEKAFAYSYVDEDDQSAGLNFMINMNTKKAVMGGQARLLTQLVQKLYHSRRALELYNDLHRGDYAAPPVSEIDGHPVVDSFMVQQIQSLNSFGAPRTSRRYFSSKKTENGSTKQGDAGHFATCGIWLLAARINHSCIGNCRRSFIGDMQIIRATKDLEAGTELCFSYRVPEDLQSYDDVRKNLSSWGFMCDCELCRSRQATPKSTLVRRKGLLKDLKAVMGGVHGTNVPGAKRLLKQIEKTYPATGATGLNAGGVRLELWDPYFALGSILLSDNKPSGAVRMIVKGLESVGFSMTASLGEADDAAAPGLEVKRWGYATEYTPWAFSLLFTAYGQLAPEVCVVAKRYAGIAYSMVMGEDETLCDEFPRLA